MMEVPAWDRSPTDRPLNVSERRMFRWLRTLGIPVVPQARIGPFTVDFRIPDLRGVIESDSRLYHLAGSSRAGTASGTVTSRRRASS